MRIHACIHVCMLTCNISIVVITEYIGKCASGPVRHQRGTVHLEAQKHVNQCKLPFVCFDLFQLIMLVCVRQTQPLMSICLCLSASISSSPHVTHTPQHSCPWRSPDLEEAIRSLPAGGETGWEAQIDSVAAVAVSRDWTPW